MKKLYTKSAYKILHCRRKCRLERRHSQTLKHNGKRSHPNSDRRKYTNKDAKILFAPDDFRLIDNTSECLTFLSDLRCKRHHGRRNTLSFAKISLRNVKFIDYGAISVLTAISEAFKDKRIVLMGDYPDDEGCKQAFINSGFLDHMYKHNGQKFRKAEKSDLIFFEKGCGKLSELDNIKISKTIKRVVSHLTGEEKQSLVIKTIVLEICGNSIEWANTHNKQWLLGTQYLDDRVIMTVTDIGEGIIETLHRKFTQQISDLLRVKTRKDVLEGAFNQKYGSSSQERNRNTGLPAIKNSHTEGHINNLKVITNDVILHFDNMEKSKVMKGSSKFEGTFYQWTMTKENIIKA